MQIKSLHRDIFPTRIWVYELNELAAHFDSWVSIAHQMRESALEPAGRSNRRGWNSPASLFEDQAAFRPLVETALQCFAHAFKQMQVSENLKFRLEAWVNLHDPGGYNLAHTHPGALLSGCFYLSMPEGAGSIVFRDPRPGVALGPYSGRGLNCRDPKKVKTGPGILVVFPNWLEHYVEANEGNEIRISIAMNAVPA